MPKVPKGVLKELAKHIGKKATILGAVLVADTANADSEITDCHVMSKISTKLFGNSSFAHLTEIQRELLVSEYESRLRDQDGNTKDEDPKKRGPRRSEGCRPDQPSSKDGEVCQ